MTTSWFRQPRETGLFAPLIPHGSDDDIGEADTRGALPADAAHYAEFSAPQRQRTGSSYEDAKRRMRRINRRLSRAAQSSKSLARMFSDASVASEATQPTDNLGSFARSDTDVSETSEYEPQTVREFEKEVPRQRMTAGQMAKSALVMAVTIAGIASYLGAFVATATVSATSAATAAVGVAGAVCILTVPWVWVSEYRLVHLPTLRARVNELRSEAVRFQREIDILIAEELDLRAEVEDLQQDQERLAHLVNEKNAGNVEDFVSLVRDNQQILDEMRENLRQAVLQDVVKMVVRADLDRDNQLSRKEANILATRLALQLEVYGIVFDADKFHRAVGLSPSLGGALTIVKRLLPDEDGRTSSFYSSGSDSDDEESTEDDVYDMFYLPVEQQFDKGCADSIRLCKEYVAQRGRRPSLISIAPSLRESLKGLRCSVGLGGCPDSPM